MASTVSRESIVQALEVANQRRRSLDFNSLTDEQRTRLMEALRENLVWIEDQGATLNYSVTLGYWISDEQLSEFKTAERLEAERLVEIHNEARSKQSNARSDAKRAEYAEVINGCLARLQGLSETYETDKWTGHITLPRTSAEKKRADAEVRKYYEQRLRRDVDDKRAHIISRIESEISNLTYVLDTLKREDGEGWSHVYPSSVNTSNHDDIVRLLTEERLLRETLDKLA